MAIASETRSSLLELPAEIRDRIYSEFWASNGFIHIQYDGLIYQVQHRRSLALPVWAPRTWDKVNFHRPLESLSLLLANKQVFQEALEELARNSAWRLEDVQRFGISWWSRLGMSGQKSASTYCTISRPLPQDFSPGRGQSLDFVVPLEPIRHYGLGQVPTVVQPFRSEGEGRRISHLLSSEPFRNNNIRHLSLTLYTAFDDVVYAHVPYAFQLEKLHAPDLVLRGLHTVDIFLAPSPRL